MKIFSIDLNIINIQIDNFNIFTKSEYKDDIINLINNFNKKSKQFVGRGEIFLYNNMVIRKYLHGGIFRNILNDNFTSKERFINELKLIFFLNSLNFPAIKAKGLIIEKNFFYKAWLVTELINGKDAIVNLTDNTLTEDIFYKFGNITKKLHNYNIIHGDLHLKNFIIDNEKKIFLIDFDKSFVSDNFSLKIKDIKRFIRSIYKFNFFNKNKINNNYLKKFLQGYGLPDNFYEKVNINFFNKISWILNKPKYLK